MRETLFRFYKSYISRYLKVNFGGGCRYSPTCSEYCSQAFKKYGLVRGILMSIRRLLRCNPFGGFGYDPLV